MQENMTVQALHALRLLRLLYRVNITPLDSREAMEQYADSVRFHPLQHMLSADSLQQLLSTMPQNRVVVISDLFQLSCVLFWLEGTPVAFGPFSPVILTTRDLQHLRLRFPLGDVPDQQLLHAANAFPVIQEREAIHIVSSLLQTIYPDAATREIVYVDYQEAPALESETSLAAKRENHTRLLEKRHAAEQSFMDAITQGTARAALQELNRMKMDVAYLKRIGTTLESERIGVTIVRTTARLAASRAGLPSLIVDRISSENTASVMRAASVESISRAEEKMVRAFCTAVRSSKSQQYSALVQSVVYAMERDYAQDLTVQALADQLDVSVNYLISACKRELGITPNAYLKQIRMKHAVRLLAGTDQTVQEVANNVGIPDANYFIKQFKAQYGETPMAYRKKYRV